MTQVNLAANRRLARSRLMWRCAPTGAEIMGRARFSHKPAAGAEPADVAVRTHRRRGQGPREI
jgi:hypothetical protein